MVRAVSLVGRASEFNSLCHRLVKLKYSLSCDCPTSLKEDDTVDNQLHLFAVDRTELLRNSLRKWLAQADRFSKFDVIVGLSIAQISADHILNFQDHLSSQGLSTTSVNRYLATISKILDWAADFDVIIKKPNVTLIEKEKGQD